MEHGSALIGACGKIDRQFCIFDLAAHGDTAGFVDEFTGIIAGDLNHLGIIVDAFVYDHQIAFGCAVLEYGRGVHRNVYHSFLHLFIQAGDDGIGVRFIPAADNSAGVVDEAAGNGIIHIRRVCAAASEQKQSDCNDEQNQDNQPCGLVSLVFVVFVCRRFVVCDKAYLQFLI